MMKTVIKFFITADEAVNRGRNFQHFGAAAAERITAHEIQVRYCLSIILDLSGGNQRRRAGVGRAKSSEDLLLQPAQPAREQQILLVG